ncbi:serine/threonine-protein phosphatase [bacterium]|nr:serine/threonine-protein phosphatase [bacterium]
MTIKTSSFDVFGKTDQGRQRRDNQDNLSPPVATSDVEEEVRATFGRLYIVADGVGGNERGDIASRMTVEHVHHYFYHALEPISDESLESRLSRAIQQASNDIFDAAINKYNNNMASTIVAALWHPDGDTLTVANVGDSRAYLFPAAGSLPNPQLSTDHVLPGKKAGLSRSMGDPDVDVATRTIPFAPDDILVLCTDGLTDLIETHEIERIVRGTGSNDAVQELIALANQRGGHDNITVTVLRNGKVPVIAQRGTQRKLLFAGGGVFGLLSLVLVLFFTIGQGGDFGNIGGGDATSEGSHTSAHQL